VTDHNKKQSVLVGLNHSVDSYVTAYLLKKQGFDVHGLHLEFLDDQTLAKYHLKTPNCMRSSSQEIKKVCDIIGIPFYGSLCVEEFEEEVVQQCYHRRLEGLFVNPCFQCTTIKIFFLYLKKKKLNCDLIATGHYAKVKKDQGSGQVAVHRPNDIKFDQSELFAGVHQNILSDLILPMGDLTKDEVHKIFRRAFPKLYEQVNKKRISCELFTDIDKTVEEQVAKDLRNQGKLMMVSTNLGVGEHEGFHPFEVGKPIEVNNPPVDYKNDQFYVFDFDFDRNQVQVETEKYMFVDHFFMQLKYAGGNFSIFRPLDVYIKIGAEQDLIPVIIYFKSLKYAFLVLREKMKSVGMGTYITIYSDTTKAGKILAMGEIVGQVRSKVKKEKIFDDDEDEVEEEKEEKEYIQHLQYLKEYPF
jgi:tRNA-specific 2-thiouridylase